MSPELAAFPDTAPCSCAACKNACRRPCWPTPEEADRLLDAGHAGRLMVDAWGEDSSLPQTYLLCPANPGHGMKFAPGVGDDFSLSIFDLFTGGGPLLSGCVFQDAAGLCGLHGQGLKPAEGRKSWHAETAGNLHLAVASAWATDEGRAVVARFCAMTGLILDAGEVA